MLTNNTFASGSLKDIKIWDINNGRCIKTLSGHTNYVRALALLPNGSLVNCSQDKSVKIWDLQQSICTKTLFGHSASKIWNLETGNCF